MSNEKSAANIYSCCESIVQFNSLFDYSDRDSIERKKTIPQ